MAPKRGNAALSQPPTKKQKGTAVAEAKAAAVPQTPTAAPAAVPPPTAPPPTATPPAAMPANTRVDEALDRVAPIVDVSVAAYSKSKAVVEAFDSITAACMKEKVLYWKSVVASDRVAVHPDNRGGAGLVVKKCFELMSKHRKVGYSYDRASAGALAQSWPTDPALQRWVTEHNVDLTRSQPDLPLLAVPQVIALGATHSNGIIRLTNGNAPCDLEDIAPNGFLDKEALTETSEGFRRACETGLTWDVYESKLFERWPALVEIFTQAANHKGTQQVGEVEGLLTIGRAADSFTKRQEPVNWFSAMESGIQTDPFWKGWAATLMNVCKVLPTESFAELTEMIKALSTADVLDNSHYGHTFLAAIASLKFNNNIVVRVPIAAMLVQAQSPPELMDSGRYSLLTAMDLNKLKGKTMFEVTLHAERVMEEARVVVGSDIPSAVRWKLLGLLDYNIMLHLTQKGHKSVAQREFTSFKAVLAEWIATASAMTGKDLNNPWTWIPEHTYDAKITNPVGRPTIHEKQQPTDKDRQEFAAANARLSLTAKKDIANNLAQRGYEVGYYVGRSLTKEEKKMEEPEETPTMKIVEITSVGEVTLERVTDPADDDDQGETIRVSHEDLVSNYNKRKEPKYQYELDWQVAISRDHVGWAYDMMKGIISTAIFLLHRDCEAVFKQHLIVKMAPMEVYVNKPLKPGELVLSPGSTHIVIRQPGSPCPTKAVDLGEFKLLTGSSSVALHIMPQAFGVRVEPKTGFNNPYWAVRKHKADDEDDIPNMGVCRKSIKMPVGTGIQTYTVVVPCITNLKKLAVDDEVVI